MDLQTLEQLNKFSKNDRKHLTSEISYHAHGGIITIKIRSKNVNVCDIGSLRKGTFKVSLFRLRHFIHMIERFLTK